MTRYDDLEIDDALALLSVPEQMTRATLSRRRLLQAAALGLGATALGPMLPGQWRDAWGTTPIGSHDGVLLVINMAGGNDGLNMVVPYTDATYYARRGALGVPAASVQPLNGTHGLHPNLQYLKRRFDDGNLAVVQGVGYSPYNLSHFTSGAIWMSGWQAGEARTGWLGRWMDGLGGGTDVFRAINIGGSIPLHLIGTSQRASGLSTGAPQFGAPRTEQERRFTAALREYRAAAGYSGLDQSVAVAENDTLDLGATVAPLYSPTLTGVSIVQQLKLAARLVNANLGVRVINATFGSFDTHAAEEASHDKLMLDLDTAIAAFYAELQPAWPGRVTLMTFSEFGREVRGNASGGTDHGTASALFVLGDQVRGGMHGQAPSLSNLDRVGRMANTVDFRSVYEQILGRWLGADANALLGANYRALDLFAAGPGDALPLPPSGTTKPTSFVPLTPIRVLDTRSGIGATGPVTGGDTVHLPLAGANGIPSLGVAAVAMNITVTEPTSGGYISVGPSGQPTPAVSNLNFSRGLTVPNAVVAPLGADGAISLFNSTGASHLIGDVVGYFATNAPAGFKPLTPARMLDTRTGGRPIGPNETLTFQVSGQNGVVADATAAVLNVTVTSPSASGYLTVWPSGVARPTASSLNFTAGQTVPNLVVAPIGADGKVNIYNAIGTSHVIVDVSGCFSPTSPARLRLAGPRRLIDSRSGQGGFTGPLASNASFDIDLAGIAGIPMVGTTAVVLNVTVTGTTGPGYLTLWPAGQARPGVSNLNYAAGQTVPNLVYAPLGTAGKVSVFASAATQVIIDLFAYFA